MQINILLRNKPKIITSAMAYFLLISAQAMGQAIVPKNVTDALSKGGLFQGDKK